MDRGNVPVNSPGSIAGGHPKSVRESVERGREGAMTDAPPIPGVVREQTVVVAEGDDLRKIARRVYGDEDLWPRILQANKRRLDRLRRLMPGMVLRVPLAD